MRIVLLADYYLPYLKSFYDLHECSDKSYDEHLEYLLDDYFGSFVSYYRYFKKRGHDVQLIIGNDYVLQQKWLDEHRHAKNADPSTKQQVVMEQIREFEPNVFFMGSMFDYYGDFLENISTITPNIFTWIACPYEKLNFSNIRCILSSSGKYVDAFRQKQIRSEILAPAFDEAINQKLHHNQKDGISFVGGLSDRTHSFRVKGLKYLFDHSIDVNLYGYGLGEHQQELKTLYRGEKWGLPMYQTLADSAMTLNFHIDVADGISGNMRLYEATGCGTLLLTEESESLHRLFTPGKEVVSYIDLDDLIEKIDFYSSNPEEAQTIAKAGQQACFDRHGYDTRIIEFERIIEKYRV